MSESCSTCRFWVRGNFQCRRHAPVIVIDEKQGFRAAQPITDEFYWCGDYEAEAPKTPNENPPDWLMDYLKK